MKAEATSDEPMPLLHLHEILYLFPKICQPNTDAHLNSGPIINQWLNVDFRDSISIVPLDAYGAVLLTPAPHLSWIVGI